MRSTRAPLLESPRALFAVLVALEAAHTALAIWQRRLPTGHDGFQFFTLQYTFLNNAVQGGGVPQWIPFMTQGTVATLWYGIQGSLLQNVLLFVPALVRHVDLAAIYHLNMFVDQFVLLLGAWLLARRFFSLPAAFFITVSVVGSCVWLDQPYWNFRFYYTLPLVFELGERFLDTGRWRWFALAVNLLAVSSATSLPYFIPATSFIVFLYFGCRLAVAPHEAWTRIRRLEWRLPALAAIVFAALSLLVAYRVMTIGGDQIVAFNNLRRRDGTVELAVFLTYGGLTDFGKWIELVFSVSPWLDATLYAGVFLLPLLLVGAMWFDRRRLHLVLMALLLLLFSMGTPVSTAAYYVWPGMKFFRHLGLTSPFVKVMFCFVAGIGFERLFDTSRTRIKQATAVAAIGGALLLAVAGGFTLRVASDRARVARYIDGLSVADEDRPRHADIPAELSRRLSAAGVRAVAAAAFIGIVPFALTGAASPRRRRALVLLMLAAASADLYRFKFGYLVDRSEVVPRQQAFLTHAAPIPYAKRRYRDLREAAGENDRMRATFGFNDLLLRRFIGRRTLGAQYWSNNAFWFADEAGSTLQVDSWLKPYDQLIRAYENLPPDEDDVRPKDYDIYHLPFPLGSVSSGKVIGVTADKIRFFSRAHTLPNADAFRHLFLNQTFTGDQLFALATLDQPPVPALSAWTPDLSLSTDETLPLAYDVTRFDFNTLEVRVANPGGAARWMSYADVWHPSWRATVNGRSVPIVRGQLAYKAVPLEPGPNTVTFEFGSAAFTWLTVLIAGVSAGWLALLVWFYIEDDAASPRRQG